MKALNIILAAILLGSSALHAQSVLKVHTFHNDDKDPVEAIVLDYDEASKSAVGLGNCDNKGQASITLQKKKYTLVFMAIGFDSDTERVDMTSDKTLEILMHGKETELEESIIVSSTRNNQPIENQPIKIEVLGKEELSEEAGVKPGNIASLLSDVSGVQIQQSSATTGNSNVRIQGLQGRYTQVLRDGMPLYDGFSGSFGILTIPPSDLAQIELIKGSASTLYGGGAIGGLINLISKKPKMDQEADVVVNYTTLGQIDGNAYLAKRYNKVGYTMFAGYSGQQAKDINGDGFSDVPKSGSILIHPKLFFFPNDKTILSVGYSGTFDDRKGGDMKVLQNNSDSVHQYFEKNTSSRHSVEFSLDKYLDNKGKITFKGEGSLFKLAESSNSWANDMTTTQTSFYTELSYYQPVAGGSVVCGINLLGANYTMPYNDTLAGALNSITNGVFGQYTYTKIKNATFEAGLRVDKNSLYGIFALPRIAVFYRFNDMFAARGGFGMGYKAPNPLSQQDTTIHPYTIAPLSKSLKSEISYGYNLEGNLKKEWDKKHRLFINHAFFLTLVKDPILFENIPNNQVALYNASGNITSMGFDTYIKLLLNGWELYGGFTYTSAHRGYLSDNSFVPLTPRTRTAFVIVKEIGEKWRFGLEGSLYGSQYRYDGSSTPAYFLSALMIMHNFNKHISMVVNCENLFDEKMSKTEALYTGTISNPDFKPLWAPIDGRVVNVSFRWKLK